MAGGHPLGLHGHRHLRGGPHQQLGGKVRAASSHHLGQGEPVHLLHLGRHLPTTGGEAHHHHRLPPPEQQYGGEGPQTPEGRAEGDGSGGRLAAIPAMGPPKHQDRPQVDSNISAAEMVYGAAFTLPGDSGWGRWLPGEGEVPSPGCRGRPGNVTCRPSGSAGRLQPIGRPGPASGVGGTWGGGHGPPPRHLAGSITEAVWPLGCSIRLNVLPFKVSMCEFLATSTARRWARRKSTPKMGKVMSASRKLHSN